MGWPFVRFTYGFHKVAPYYYTGWHEPGAELQFMVNEKAYNKLPKDLQKILTVAMKAAAYDMYAQSYHESAKNLATLAKDYPNVKMRSFPEPVMNAIKATNASLLKEFAAKDPMTAEILKSLSDYQVKVRAWTNLSDRAYLETSDKK